MIFLDTHVAVWLYAGHLGPFPADVQKRIDREGLMISPYVQFELSFLYEVGKVTVSPDVIVTELSRKLELSTADASVATVCGTARELSWTRDPFDRLISAHAVAADMPLVTKDRTIRNNLSLAWWG